MRLPELLQASAALAPPARLSGRAHANQAMRVLAPTSGQHGGGVASSWRVAGHQEQRESNMLAVVLDGAARDAADEVLFRSRRSGKWPASCHQDPLGALMCQEQYLHGHGGLGGPWCTLLA